MINSEERESRQADVAQKIEAYLRRSHKYMMSLRSKRDPDEYEALLKIRSEIGSELRKLKLNDQRKERQQ